MNTILRKDGSLYIKLHDEDAYRNVDNGVEMFLSPEQVEMIRYEIDKKVI